MKKKFNFRSTDVVKKYVGYELDENDNCMILKAKGYIEAMLKRFNLEEAKTAKLPGKKGTLRFDKNSKDLKEVRGWNSFIHCKCLSSRYCLCN